DTLTGNAGDDTLTGGLGNDSLVGGTGTDTAVFSFNFSASAVTVSGGSVVVTRADGVDTLSGIERLQFADKTVILVGFPGTISTIQAGITAASAGNVVLVAPGTYTENVTVNKAVDVVGPYAGTAGSAAGRSAAAGTGEASLVGRMVVTSSGSVTIDGLRFVANSSTGTSGGNNPALLRTSATNGGTHVYRNNIFYSTLTNGGTGASGGTDARAIQTQTMSTGSTTISGNLITGDGAPGDKFDTARWGRGAWVDGGGTSTTTLTNNVFEYVRTGMNLENYGPATLTVTGNTIRNAGSGISGGPGAAAAVGSITGTVLSNVNTDFNLNGAGAALTFDVNNAVATTTASTEVITTIAGAFNDQVTASTTNPDSITAGAGNDTILGAGAGDSVIGGTGTDQVNFTGTFASYTVGFTTLNSAPAVSITSGSNTVTVRQVEKLQFSDKSLLIVGAGSEYPAIQPAIDAATAGDVVLVAAGTYNLLLGQQIRIDKALTLLGAQASVVATGATRTGGETEIVGALGAGQAYEAVRVTASGVTIDGFKISNFYRDGITVQQSATETAPGLSTRQDVRIANNWIEKGDVGLSTSNG
ncbi:MAG: hypothetical protein ACK5EA_25985, partial [Planctomycetaceae bacterium]